jgi:hypothetical protein
MPTEQETKVKKRRGRGRPGPYSNGAQPVVVITIEPDRTPINLGNLLAIIEKIAGRYSEPETESAKAS